MYCVRPAVGRTHRFQDPFLLEEIASPQTANKLRIHRHPPRLIRKKLGAKCPFIFALTAEALEGDKQRFLGLGFDGYLSKPLLTHTLQDTLRAVRSSTQLAKA
jgi:CheY-like chemotaxis protein